MIRKLEPSEHQIQCAIVEWANNTKIPHSNHNIGKFIFAIPNGGNRSITEALRLKKEGVKKGVSDLCFPYPSFCYEEFQYKYFSLWLEVKSKKGKISECQKEWIELMKAIGNFAKVVYSVDEGIQAIKDYLGMI